MARPEALLTPPRLVWVEGKDDSAVVQSLCRAYQLPQSFDVEEQNGLERLMKGFGVAIRAAGLERFGVVIDADGDVSARWGEIRRVLKREGYQDVPDSPAPDGTILPATELLPRLGVWLMPDNVAAGAIEEFATMLIPADDPLLEYASASLDGMPADRCRFAAKDRRKALVRTWLAWQKSPGSPMGQAISKGDLRADAPAAQHLVAWLRRLMVDDAVD